MNIDWSATGQMLAGWGSWAQALGVFVAAYFAKQAAENWRSQRVAETKMDVATSYLEKLLPRIEDAARIYKDFEYQVNFEFQQTVSLADYVVEEDIGIIEQASNHHFERLYEQAADLMASLRGLDDYNPKLLILFQIRPQEVPHQKIATTLGNLIKELHWFGDPKRDPSRRDEAFNQLRKVDAEGDLALIRKHSEDRFIREARGEV